MKCQSLKNYRRIEKYVMNQLPVLQTERFERHLFQCLTCVEYTRHLQNVIEFIRKAGAAGMLEEKVIPANIIKDLRREVTFAYRLRLFLLNILRNGSEWVANIAAKRRHYDNMLFGDPQPAYKILAAYRIIAYHKISNRTLALILVELLDLRYPVVFAFSS